MSLHTLVNSPSTSKSTLLSALDAFGDAGAVQAATVDLLRGQLDFEVVATFDVDQLIDYRVRRPTVKVRGGMLDQLTWPTIELSHARDDKGHDILLLHGPEPDRQWRSFVEEVIDLVLRFDVEMLLGLGSFPGPVPHTRPIEVATTATDPTLARRVAYLPDELEVPATVHSAIEHAAAAQGISALGLWAPVPQYAAMQPYPASALALLDAIRELRGIEVSTQTLSDGAEATRKRIEAAIADKPDHRRMVEALEQHVESMEAAASTDLPSGDELAEQLQQFLEEGE